MLHTINKTPLKSDSLASCLRFARKGDPILLIEDGVYAAQAGAKSEEMVQSSLNDHAVYALEGDIKARGLQRLIGDIKVIDYDGFVDLVEQHQVNTWL